MSTSSTNRNLLVIIGVLLLTNIGVLGYFLCYKKHPKPPIQQQSSDRGGGGVSESLQKEVGFNAEQMAQYKDLKDSQRAIIRPMFESMRKAKDSLFQLVDEAEVSDSQTMQAADQIAGRQKALDLQTFSYFRKVRALCTPDQIAKYDSVVIRMLKRSGRRPGNDSEKPDKPK